MLRIKENKRSWDSRNKQDVENQVRIKDSCMGWLRLVGSLKLHVCFAKEPYKRDDPQNLENQVRIKDQRILGITGKKILRIEFCHVPNSACRDYHFHFTACCLQCVAVCCSGRDYHFHFTLLPMCRSVLQCVAACCSVKQCVAVLLLYLLCQSRTLPTASGCVAVCCRVLQCVAVCCSVL